MGPEVFQYAMSGETVIRHLRYGPYRMAIGTTLLLIDSQISKEITSQAIADGLPCRNRIEISQSIILCLLSRERTSRKSRRKNSLIAVGFGSASMSMGAFFISFPRKSSRSAQKKYDLYNLMAVKEKLICL